MGRRLKIGMLFFFTQDICTLELMMEKLYTYTTENWGFLLLQAVHVFSDSRCIIHNWCAICGAFVYVSSDCDIFWFAICMSSCAQHRLENWRNIYIICMFFFIFTALYGMQTRSSDENSVRPSVRLSNAWIMTVFHFWPKPMHPTARSFCDSWATCYLRHESDDTRSYRKHSQNRMFDDVV